MTEKPTNVPGIAPAAQSGPVYNKSEAIANLQSNGPAGYIALGSILVSLLERSEHPELKRIIEKYSDEEYERLISHANAIMQEGSSSLIKREIKAKSDKLWIQALDGGLRTNLDQHRRSVNEDIDSLIESNKKLGENLKERLDELEVEVKKFSSFYFLCRGGIISGIALGIFLAVIQVIENPFSGFLETMSAKNMGEEVSDHANP